MDAYAIAINARLDAETGQEPEKYRLAAELFRAIGMESAAQRMDELAEHYKIEGGNHVA